MAKEIYKTLDFNPRYAVSNYGNVKIIKTGKIVVPMDRGYLCVRLFDLRKKKGEPGFRKDYRIHRLVGMYFIENPKEKPYINHIDGNKHNNHVDNLE